MSQKRDLAASRRFFTKGHSHAHTIVTVHVTEHPITVDFPDGA